MKVETLHMGDCEDPYLYAAFPLYEWGKTDKGKWIHDHALETPIFYCNASKNWGFDIDIYADFSPINKLFFLLKYAKK